MHLLNILQSIPRFALCSSISVQAAPLGRNRDYLNAKIVLHFGDVTILYRLQTKLF